MASAAFSQLLDLATERNRLKRDVAWLEQLTTLALPLTFAALCVSCDHLFDLRLADCPNCGEGSWLSLSRILNRAEAGS